MRKLILQMQMSADGFVQYGENDTQSWLSLDWEGIKNDVLGWQRSCDTQIIGRKLAVDFIPYWMDTAQDPSSQMYELALHITGFRKIVFSKSLDSMNYYNTELEKGDVKDAVLKLKSEPGKNIMVVGGSSFVSSLIRENLIDEFYLFINPVLLGKRGVPIFQEIKDFRKMKLIKSATYSSGIVLLHYSLTK